MYKVLITTSGTGSRLGDLTKDKNKALVDVGGKTVIERIIDSYPADTNFVVTIGYHGEQVRWFLLGRYPQHTFEFVEVDTYTGEGSSLGYSMLCAKDKLQCPFIFHCNDTLVEGEIPPPTENWIGVYDKGDAAQYSTWKSSGGVPRFQDKGATDFDHIHIGIVGIKDYAQYWEVLKELYATHPEDQGLNDCKVLTRMIAAGTHFEFESFSEWFDTGNPVALARAVKGLSTHNKDEYKVLITASGVGGPLGELAKYTNKALVRVGKKPVISHIVEAYPADTKYVVTLGHFGEQVREFLTLAYPERHFEFVEVDTYTGEGSSLGYSMLCAKEHLQCPFIFHASDTIVTEPVPVPDTNWIGISLEGDTELYTSWKLTNGTQLILNEKGVIHYDFIHIGLIGINDYAQFWMSLASLYAENPRNSSLNDCRTIERMIARGAAFTTHTFKDWYDTGSASALRRARARINDHFENLDKLEESIFFFKDFVIKFFYDEKINAERVARGEALGSLVPPLEGTSKHFYRYHYADGHTYAEVATPADFQQFLSWTKENLWHPVAGVEPSAFRAVCKDFYYTKTKKRVENFLAQNNLQDQAHVINGESVPSVETMLTMVDFDWLANAAPFQFHGDFILENIIKTKDGYCLIDWRQNFGGLLNAGDIYYDLAKLNHNLTVNHDMINKDHYSVTFTEDGEVTCDIFRRNNLVECQEVLWRFVEREGFDLKRVRLLSAIIWLNMAPLHHRPFDQFLYYFGKLHLWRAIQDLKK